MIEKAFEDFYKYQANNVGEPASIQPTLVLEVTKEIPIFDQIEEEDM